MPQLNQKQAEFAKTFLQKTVSELIEKKNFDLVCYFCEKEFNFKIDLGCFFPVAPLRDKQDENKGLILDDLMAVWVCVKCIDRRAL